MEKTPASAEGASTADPAAGKGAPVMWLSTRRHSQSTAHIVEAPTQDYLVYTCSKVGKSDSGHTVIRPLCHSEFLTVSAAVQRGTQDILTNGLHVILGFVTSAWRVAIVSGNTQMPTLEGGEYLGHEALKTQPVHVLLAKRYVRQVPKQGSDLRASNAWRAVVLPQDDEGISSFLHMVLLASSRITAAPLPPYPL